MTYVFKGSIYHIKIWHIKIIYNGILFSHKKGNSDVCNNMNGPWGHYAKWNKSDTERQYSMISLICGI